MNIEELSEIENKLYEIVKKAKEIPMETIRTMKEGEKLMGAIGKLSAKGIIEIKRLTQVEQVNKKLRKVLKLK